MCLFYNRRHIHGGEISEENRRVIEKNKSYRKEQYKAIPTPIGVFTMSLLKMEQQLRRPPPYSISGGRQEGFS